MNKIIIIRGLTVLCIIIAVILRFAMDSVEVAYEEVKVTVVSSESKVRVLKKTNSKTTTYDVKVRYEGETYDLQNVYNSYSYQPGGNVKAYLSEGELYANTQGVQTSTSTAKAYFAFLFISFGMILASSFTVGKKPSK